jgi:hypothetical protein
MVKRIRSADKFRLLHAIRRIVKNKYKYNDEDKHVRNNNTVAVRRDATRLSFRSM